MPFDYTSGNPDNLTGGAPARMQDIQGPFYDIRAYLNTLSGGGGGGGGGVQVSAQVSDVGQPSQVRAGRQLALSDFTSLGLSAPRGLWNLSDLTDSSGNGRALTNKGGVAFVGGINGNASTAAQFTGSTGQALYITDTGASDPFRISTGSWGCWFRTAKRGTEQMLLTKWRTSVAQRAWLVDIHASNVVQVIVTFDGTANSYVLGVSDVADDRWHFVVATFDGTTLRAYVDGVLEASGSASGAIFAATSPVNIGAYDADGGTAAGLPHYGRVDEAFVTADVLTEDQIRLLYAARIPHTLGATPKQVSLSVRRRRRGGTLAVADFSTQPLRLHNFTDTGWLNDEGSNGVSLSNALGAGGQSVAGADGLPTKGVYVPGSGDLRSTDAGLPSGTNARTYGCWFKTANTGTQVIIGWGTVATADARLTTASGSVTFTSAGDQVIGPYVADGQWHHAIAVEDNAAGDGVKRKLYLDGRLVGGSTTLNSIGGAGAQPRFRVGANPDGTAPFTGQIDGAFVCGYAMTMDEVTRLYLKSSQAMPGSPKNAGDHVEGFDSGSIYFVGDTLEGQHYVDVTVS